jgi:peptidoglycan/LPS O-acetylase OafA/YrhL
MKEHIKSLDFLRGIAALGVVLYHYSGLLLPTLNPNYFTSILAYGEYGVQIFFVISGFIIPYSMTKSNYTLNDFWKNLYRRYIRLAPPAYVAMLFSILIYFSAIILLKRPINGISWPGTNWQAILGNLTFTAPLIHSSWYNPVFWTLAIEFQFYALIGLLLPLILTRKYYVALIISFTILLIGHNRPDYLDWFGWFFGHASFFFLGILLFLKKEKILTGIPFIVLTLLTITICYYQNSFAKFSFGMFAFCIILFQINISFKLATYIGGISYSLYIIHWPFGILIESIMKRILPIHEYPIGKLIMLVFYTLLAIVFAHFFNQFIEKKCLELSKKLK